MSALEVLQSCLAQRKLLLFASSMAFQIPVIVKNRPIQRTVIDEGASMCIMSIQFWRSLCCPLLNQSPTILKAFDGRGFHPFWNSIGSTYRG
jgi:hypothetical protein